VERGPCGDEKKSEGGLPEPVNCCPWKRYGGDWVVLTGFTREEIKEGGGLSPEKKKEKLEP